MPRLFCLAVALASSLVSSAKAAPILLCGGDEVFIVDAATAAEGKIEKTWSWKAAQCGQLPEAFRRTFATTDDCKPADGGAKILISSSSGGCALVAHPSGKALWYAQVPNAHSLETHPDERNCRSSRPLFFSVGLGDQPDQFPRPSMRFVANTAHRQHVWCCHKSSYFSNTELDGCAETVRQLRLDAYDLLSLRASRTRLYRSHSYWPNVGRVHAHWLARESSNMPAHSGFFTVARDQK